MKKGSFVKTQKFVNGELVEESVEELDDEKAKAVLKVCIVRSALFSAAFHTSPIAILPIWKETADSFH
jgi:hypothetical protein